MSKSVPNRQAMSSRDTLRAVETRKNPFVDRIEYCLDRHASADPQDGKCSVNFTMNNNMNLDIMDVADVALPQGLPTKITNNDSDVMSLDVNFTMKGGAECVKLAKCITGFR